MLVRALALIVGLIYLCGCGGVSFPELKGVTKAVVRTNLDEPIRQISDPDQINEIVSFVNARRAGWDSPWPEVLVPERVVNFYEGEHFVGYFGWGKNFFETQRDSRGFFSREAEPGEVREFQRLVGMPSQ